MVKVFYFHLFISVFVFAKKTDISGKIRLSLNHTETRYRRNWVENFAKESDKEFWPNFGKRIIGGTIVPSQIRIFGNHWDIEERAKL